MSLKQQFKELLEKIKKESGHTYETIAESSGIKISVIRNAGSKSDRYFKVTQEDYNALKEAYSKKESTPTPNSMAQDLKEIKEMVKSQSEMVKQQYETITTKGKDIIDATIKAIAEKHNMSIEEVMVSFEKMLVERLKEDQSQDTKKG